MSRYKVSKWIDHPRYFLLWSIAGLFVWTYFFIAENSKPQVAHFSSMSVNQDDLDKTEYAKINLLHDKVVMSQLEKMKNRWTLKNESNFSRSPQFVDKWVKRNSKELPDKFQNNPIFRLLDFFSDGQAKVNYEEPLLCNTERQFYERRILSDPLLAEYKSPRIGDSFKISNQCVTHIMNTHEVPNINYANCATSNAAVKIPGAKPCVSANLVNLTRNAILDVAECLEVDPRHIVPRMSSESGFFLNSFSSEKDSGAGQLNQMQIAEVNVHYDKYLKQIYNNSENNLACKNLIKYRSFLNKASAQMEHRCSLMALPENPLRNFLYTILYYRIGVDKLNNDNEKINNIQAGLKKLGLANLRLSFIKQMLVLNSFNIGLESSINMLEEFIKKRIEHNLPLQPEDFNFYSQKLSKDVNGDMVNSVSLARSFVMSSFINPLDTPEVKALKVLRRKQFPKLWSKAYQLSFPEYLAYRSNSYDGLSMKAFEVFGVPGYLNVLADKNQQLNDIFFSSDLDEQSCVDKSFLKTDSN